MERLDRNARLLLAAALAVALLIRIAALLFPVDPYANPDSLSFQSTAETMVREGRIGYVDRDIPGCELRAFRSILYSGLLALGISTGAGTKGVLFIQGLLGAAVVGAVAVMAFRIYGRRAGLAAAWFGALYWTPVLWERQVMSEALYTPLLVFGTLVAVEALHRRGVGGGWTGRAFGGGILLGLATLVRPVGILAAAAVGLAALFAEGDRFGPPRGFRTLRRRAVLPLVLLAGLLVVVGPLVVRNAAVVGRPVLLTSGGHNFWIGNGLGTRAEAWAIMAEDLPDRGEAAMDRWFYDEMKSRAGELVRAAPGLLVSKMKTTLDPISRNPVNLPYRLFLPLAIVGFAVARPLFRPGDWVVKLVPLSQIALAILSLPGQRYRSPADPFLWLLAAVAAVALWERGPRMRAALALYAALQAALFLLLR